jgi:pimeloyl-ACP methyl ester carboxylesterase
VVLALLALVACGAPIRVRQMDSQGVHRTLTESVITTGEPSVTSRIVLQRRGLADRYEDEPEAALAEMHGRLVEGTTRPSEAFALAELSYHHAEHGGGAPHYLASAVYAWVYLFATDRTARPDAFDPRFRAAADIYNLGLTKAFQVDGGPRVELTPGPRALPFGTMDVALSDEQLRWAGRRLTAFVAASELRVIGLRNRYRHPGVGAPLAATTGPLDAEKGFQDFIFPRIKIPVTAVLRLADAREGMASGHLQATLELHPASGSRVIDVDGRQVPLEIEPTSALAYGLSESSIWSRELEGFRSGDLVTREKQLRLGGLEPYRPDRIPVVLVHGTASSPGRWAEMLNDLHNDSRIRERFQFWAFVYDTGNPIVYSGMLFRESLGEAVARFDPEGDDACLHQMVVIGHSQGGLLTKLTAVDSGDRFWANISSKPLDDLRVSEETRDLLRRTAFVKPLPYVRRLVFIATPHGGSYRAGAFVQWLVARITSLPGRLTRTATEIMAASPESQLRAKLRRMPTSIDNMTPGNPFIRALSEMPIDPSVSAHSIIAVRGSGPFEEGNDGVVAYESAHIDGVESELVVRSAHSTQAEPATIEEVRRILLLHSARVRETSPCR